MAGKKDIVKQALEVASEAFAPEKTVKAYKLFKQRDGKLYPLYVGANEEVPLGQWLKAKPGELLPSGKVKAEISGGLAYRPGWHAGDLPVATHIGAKSHGNPRLPPDTRRSDEVWAEVEMPDDVDWQSVANERARITKKGTPDPKTAHITDQVPYGGFYRYKTSPTMQGQWLIGGDMRVNRLLTDDEVKAINDAAGVTDLPRREGYAGKGRVVGDAVEQALKLVSGGLKEAGPSAAERAAQNLEVLNTAKRLGQDTNDISKLQETKQLMDFHSNMMGGIKERAQELAEVQRQLKEQGAFPMEIGTRFMTSKSREYGRPPHVVTGYYVNPKDPYNSYGYRVRQDFGNGDYTEGNILIRDPKLEKLHGPEKWQQLQQDFTPMTGPRVKKDGGGEVREGYQTKGRVVGDIVDEALKLVMGKGESAAEAGIRAYHGTPEKGLTRLSTRHAVETPNAVFAAQNPDVAHTFTVPREYGEPVYVDEFGNDIEPGEVFELNLRPQNPFSIPPEEAQKFIDDTAVQTRMVKEAREKGHDLVVAPNVMEGIGERSPGDVYAILDDRIISIIRKYGIAGASSMLGYNLMENLDANQAQAATVADKEYQATQPEVRGGMLPPGMEPSGEMTSRTPSASERIYDYVRSVLGGDETTKGQRAETVMNLIDQTPLAVGPMAYDIGRSVAEAVRRADGGPVRKGYADGGDTDPYADEVASAKSLMADRAYEDQPWGDWAEEAVGNALLTAQKVLPTALGGTGEVGITDIARGAYEGGKDAVMFPGDVISGKQALYDEYGRPLEQAVGRSFNAASTVGGAASVVPRPANSLGVFGGTKSLTADKNALTKAQIMESQAASPDSIWEDAGWGRGAEGRWRYEMPDTEARVDPSKFQIDLSTATMTPDKVTTLGEYLSHPEVFAAYPEFKNMVVKGYNDPNSSTHGYYRRRYEGGASNPGVNDPYIALNLYHLDTPAKQRETLLHELQHAIQQKEGFAPGSNVFAQPDATPNPLYSVYKEALQNDQELKELIALRSSPEYRAEDAEKQALFGEYSKAIGDLDVKSFRTGVDTKEEYEKLTKEYFDAVKDKFPLSQRAAKIGQSLKERGIPSYEPVEYLDPFGAYEAHAGEVEARNVQNRMDMMREDLKVRPPWRTQDQKYPYEGQLIDWNNTSWRKGYAGRGRVIKNVVDEAVDLATRLFSSEEEDALNLAAREAAKKPAEIRTIKGADLLKKTEGLSDDPFGFSKFSKPLNEMEYTVKMLPREEYKTVDPYDLVRQNATIVGHISDRTAAGRELIDAGGNPLTNPLVQRGGVDYQRTTPHAWANRPGAAQTLYQKVNEPAGYQWDKKTKQFVKTGEQEGPVYTTPIFMGAPSANSSHMVGVPFLRMIPNMPISKADKLAFDAMMSERFPGWPGIDNTKEAEEFLYHGNLPKNAPTAFTKYAAAKKWRLGAGFPDIEEIMFSAMDPRLVGVKQGTTGMGFKEIDPNKKIIIKGEDYHPDYPAAIPGKKYAGGFKYQTPQGIMFPEWWGELKPELRLPENATGAQYAAMTQLPTQKATPEWADRIMQYWEENPIPWGYADGGAVDEDIDDALRIARADGGANSAVMMEDAKGNKYDAQGNVIPPTAPTGPNPQRDDSMFTNTAPENYKTDVQPFIDYAVTPIDRPGMPSEPDLVDVMRVATQVAAEGQPTDDRGEGNFGRRRAETVRSLVGASPEGYQSDYKGPFTYNAGDTANFLNTLIDFSPYGALEYAHDIPYEAGRTGDYGNAAVEGGVGALMTVPGMTIAGRGLKKGYEAVKSSPKMAAGIAGVAGLTASSDEAEAGPARWFSKAMEVAGALPMEKMTGEQALAMLRKGVPSEELKWTGTEAFLSGRPQVSKGELLEHLKNNRVQVNEVVLGGGDKPTRLQDILPSQVPEPIRAKYRNGINDALALQAKYTNEANRLLAPDKTIPYDKYAEYKSLLGKAQQAGEVVDRLSIQMRQEYVDSIGGLGRPTQYGPGSRYGDRFYTPGGKNYQETTFNIPPQKVELVEWPVIDAFGNVKARYDSKEAAERVARTSGSTVGEPRTTIVEKGYRSSHWPELNTLGHIRTQILEAELPGSNRPLKLFNVDEAQSDYAQDVRKYGLREGNGENASKKLNEFTQQMADRWVTQRAEQLYQGSPELFSGIEEARNGAMRLANQRGATAIAEELGVADELEQLIAADERYRKGLDPAPYVTNTQHFTDFSIKKALDQAIDSGADYFTFTPGEVHADRYDLARDLAQIEYEPGDYGTYSISAIGKNGKNVLDKDMDIDEIEEYFGKEIAKKIKADEGRKMEDRPYRDWRVLENEQIKAKGDAMVDAYNNIYKKRVEKVVKEATGKKVTWEVLPAKTANGIVPRLGFRIDEDVKNARFSDFNKGGRVTGGNAYDNNQVVDSALALTREF